MTQTLTEARPTAASEARHFLDAATRQAAQHGSALLTHAVDRAVVHALLGAGTVLLGDPRGRQHLATASDLLRRHSRSEQADGRESAIAHTLLAILYGLVPGLPGQNQYALYHLEQAGELAEAHDGGEAPTAGDVLVQSALTGLAYAQLTAYAQLAGREAR
ncbi:hypothetical protein AB0F17_59645 [Nonomuraea sp. NPDC026600]|uniref:hypothetical protein n=1 Tax=Nonomuraea sp. NPDC026600 TaxID=3155363 RepID=UPI00341055CD